MRSLHDIDELLARIDARRVVASISGGKDSAAMSLYLKELGIEHDRVFLDTGWESDVTYEYLRSELPRVIGPIEWVRNPRHRMVKLLLRKGMFPSRLRRFCTQELKIYPMQAYLAGRDDAINAVGIRHGESEERAKFDEWEWSDGFYCETWRPLVTWTEQDVIDIHTRHGLRPNPLYLKGASRVGCWPCIYARKAEIRLVADADPGRIDLIRRLEQRVGRHTAASPTWFNRPSWGGIADTRIDDVVEWSRTSRGGRQLELFAAPESERGCMRWGLCETDDPEGG